MNVTWLRRLARRYGPIGLVVAAVAIGCCWLWKRAPLVLLALCVAIALYLFLLTGSRSQPPSHDSASYAVTDLGTLPGGTVFVPTGINNRRQISGHGDTGETDGDGEPIIHVGLWQGGAIRDLGGFGGIDSFAGRLSESGQIAVTVRHGEQDYRAFLWDGRAVPLPGAGGRISSAASPNARGQVAGLTANSQNQRFKAVYWDRTRLMDPRIDARSRFSSATAINDAGALAGWMLTDRQLTGFTWLKGDLRRLPPVRGEFSAALSMNNRSDVIGISTIDPRDSDKFHAAQWTAGKPRDLGGIRDGNSIAEDINDSGVAVGGAETARNEWRAVAWKDGRLIDLNSQIPRREGWVLLFATAVNNRGDIAGLGIKGEEFRGFLLTAR